MLASILALDITSYTRHIANDGLAAIATTTEFYAVYRGHIESNGKDVADLAGDSILGAFGNANGTSRTAAYAQAAVAWHNVELPNPPHAFSRRCQSRQHTRACRQRGLWRRRQYGRAPGRPRLAWQADDIRARLPASSAKP